MCVEVIVCYISVIFSRHSVYPHIQLFTLYYVHLFAVCQTINKVLLTDWLKILRFFDFSRWRPSTFLDLFGAYLDHPQWVLGSLHHSAKFGYGRCSSFYNMNISIFRTFRGKMPIHAPKIGIFGQFDPLNGLQYQPKPKKAHPCVSLHHMSH